MSMCCFAIREANYFKRQLKIKVIRVRVLWKSYCAIQMWNVISVFLGLQKHSWMHVIINKSGCKEDKSVSGRCVLCGSFSRHSSASSCSPPPAAQQLWDRSGCILGLWGASSVFILTAMPGGRCDSYFIGEETGIEKLLDLFKVTHPVSDGEACPALTVWLRRWGCSHKAVLLTVERAVLSSDSGMPALVSRAAVGWATLLPAPGAGPSSVRVRSCSGGLCSCQTCAWLILLASLPPHPGEWHVFCWFFFLVINK